MVKEAQQELKSLTLFGTERRRLKKDVVKVYRIMKVVDSVNAHCYSSGPAVLGLWVLSRVVESLLSNR